MTIKTPHPLIPPLQTLRPHNPKRLKPLGYNSIPPGTHPPNLINPSYSNHNLCKIELPIQFLLILVNISNWLSFFAAISEGGGTGEEELPGGGSRGQVVEMG